MSGLEENFIVGFALAWLSMGVMKIVLKEWNQ